MQHSCRRLRALERQNDQRTGMRTRTFIAVITGLVWTLTPIVGGELLGPALGYPRPTFGPLYAIPTICLFLLMGVGYWARESLMATPLNQRFGLSIMALLVLQPGLIYIGERNGLDVDVVLTLLFAYWTSLSTMAAISLHPQLALMAVGYAITTALSSHFPEHNLRLVAFGNFVFTLNLLWMGQPVLREDRARRREQRRSSLPPRARS